MQLSQIILKKVVHARVMRNSPIHSKNEFLSCYPNFLSHYLSLALHSNFFSPQRFHMVHAKKFSGVANCNCQLCSDNFDIFVVNVCFCPPSDFLKILCEIIVLKIIFRLVLFGVNKMPTKIWLSQTIDFLLNAVWWQFFEWKMHGSLCFTWKLHRKIFWLLLNTARVDDLGHLMRMNRVSRSELEFLKLLLHIYG